MRQGAVLQLREVEGHLLEPLPPLVTAHPPLPLFAWTPLPLPSFFGVPLAIYLTFSKKIRGAAFA